MRDKICLFPICFNACLFYFIKWRQASARVLMPPPRPSNKSLSNSVHGKSRFDPSTSRNQVDMSTSTSNTSNSRSSSFNARESSNSRTGGHGSNLSSNSDAHKPRRKRRPKKKKQQVKFAKHYSDSYLRLFLISILKSENCHLFLDARKT